MGGCQERKSSSGYLLLLGLLLGIRAGPPVRAQEPSTFADQAIIERLLDSNDAPALSCSIEPQKPFLDFAFRFEVTYTVHCPLRSFEKRASTVWVYARVTPEGAKPQLRGESYRVPEATATATPGKQAVEMTGGFAAGEGQYKVEVLVADQETGRVTLKSWSAHVTRASRQRDAQVAIPHNMVMPLAARPRPFWLDASGKGLHLTVLLNAAPMDPRSPKLQAWDRAFLLESLSSLLGQIPCASVRLRAINLDQQREVYRQDDFDDSGFVKLSDALRSLELGTISAQVLQNRSGWMEMLVDFANQEVSAAHPSDAVIILGPRSHYNAAVSRQWLKGRETSKPQFCYFEYLPGAIRFSQLPDTLSNLTRRLDGAVYQMYSPGDLAHAIQKMLARVQPTASPPSASPPADSRWPPRPAPTQ